MSRLSFLLVAALLLAPLGLAQDATAPPAAAHVASAGASQWAWFVGPDPRTVNESALVGGSGSLWLAVSNLSGANVSRFAVVNVSSDVLAFDNASFTVQPAGNASWSYQVAAFDVPANASGSAAFALSVSVYERLPSGETTLVGSGSGEGSVALEGSAQAPAPAIPVSYYVAAGAAVLLVAGVVGYSLRQRSLRRRMNEGPKRSQVMREVELEKKLEKAQQKDPEQAAQIKAEIRQQEQVREKRREVQILEAKRADVLKTMDLLRKRHEAGGLSKHQYDNMLAKKKADLERIEAEIAQMESEDAGSGAAA